MQQEILWRSLEDHALEHCSIGTSATGISVRSVIAGRAEGRLFHVFYTIDLTKDWITRSFDILSRVSGKEQALHFRRADNGVWSSGDGIHDALRHCTDIDISLTPFTNTLPVNRLQLRDQEEQLTDVVYIDVLQGKVAPMRQSYKRVSAAAYLFRSLETGFEAMLQTDPVSGLVTLYPGLFEQVDHTDF